MDEGPDAWPPPFHDSADPATRRNTSSGAPADVNGPVNRSVPVINTLSAF